MVKYQMNIMQICRIRGDGLKDAGVQPGGEGEAVNRAAGRSRRGTFWRRMERGRHEAMSKGRRGGETWERVTSPEQLNDHIRVTQPGVWVVLGVIVALLIGVILWGIFGEIDGIHPIWFILH